MAEPVAGSGAGDEAGAGGRDRLLTGIVIGIGAGVLLGGFVPAWGSGVAFLGELFLRALKMMVVPLVVLSLMAGVTGLGDIRKLGTVGRRTIVYYLLTTGLAVLVGMFLVAIIRPGVGVDISGVEQDAALAAKATTVGQALRDMVQGLLPANVVKAAADTEVLQLILFSLFFGAVLSTFGDEGRPVVALIEVLNRVVMRMTLLIMVTAPVGIGCLVAGRLGAAGGFSGFWPQLQGLLKYAVTVILGLLVHGLVTLPLLLLIFARTPLPRYLRAVSEALLTAFSTASSSATLPLSYRCTTEQAKVSERTCSFVLPLGATVNMDGTALYEAVAAIFIAEAYGIHLGPSQYVIVFLTATLAAIGAAGIPEAGLVTMLIVLNAVGLPVEGVSLIVVIDWFLDRCRTTVNVWGDIVGCAVIDRYEQRDAAADTAAPESG